MYEPTSQFNGESFRAALDAVVAEIEGHHLVTIENVTVGDDALDGQLNIAIAAAREAMINAAKFSGVRSMSVYARLNDQACEIYVRDRGVGFTLGHIPADRHGIRDSIVGRVERAQGAAEIRTAVGQGAEVRISVPRVAL
jgi:signal transduction histidine kinase